MKTNKSILGLAFTALVAFMFVGVQSARAQGTKFTYQGRLLDAGSPASGNYDLRFTVWDSAAGGLQVGGAVVVAPVAVSSGLFAVPLDFGGAVFTGPARWLQIESQLFGGGGYTTIATRQELTAAPYAITAGSLTGSLPDGGLSPNVALLNRNPQTFTGQNNFSGHVTLTDPSRSLTFPATAGANAPMINMFASGTGNANRMVIAHSPAFPNYGLQYEDPPDKFHFLSGGTAVMTIDLGTQRVGIGKANPESQLDVNGDIRLNDFDLRIRAGTDNNHGLGWRAALDGPFLYGFNGGGLGTSGPDTFALTWSYLGSVQINSNLFVGHSLSIQGSGNFSFDSPNSTLQFPATGGANNPMINMFASGTGNANRMVIAHSPAFPDWGLQYQDSGDKFHFLSSGSAVMTVDLGSGRVGIGTATPSFQLQLSADSAAKPNGGSWANSSDARIKKNIRPLTGALDQLSKLRGVKFDWINPEDHANQTTAQGGFIAQEVERVFPHWVQEVPGAEHDRSLTPNGQVKSLSLPFEFDALLIEALRELRAEQAAKITALEKANADMKKELAAQKEFTSRMEARFATMEKVVARLGKKGDTTLISANH